jgi:UPF0716 protein FxsA
MWLFAIFVAVPILEIALFIQLGGWLGLWPTLAIVVATAFLGTVLVRRQGLAQLAAVQASLSELRDPTAPLAHGAMILAAGLLLLTPGFFTDAVGFALLVPQVRALVIRHVRARVSVASFQMGPGARPDPRGPRGVPPSQDVVEGEVIEPEMAPEDARRPRSDRPSGWTRGG